VDVARVEESDEVEEDDICGKGSADGWEGFGEGDDKEVVIEIIDILGEVFGVKKMSLSLSSSSSVTLLLLL
jgi:hypothetical protein